jgi:Ig-like domain from next to BRCA1 gene
VAQARRTWTVDRQSGASVGNRSPWIAGILGGLIVVVVGAYLTGHLPGGGSFSRDLDRGLNSGRLDQRPTTRVGPWGYKSGLVSETLPDSSRLPENRRAVKTWTIENEGHWTWTGLTLRRVTPREVSTDATVPLPTTAPGERCTIRVPLRTPGAPGRVEEKWALFDAQGKRILPPGGELTINLVVQ